MYFGLRSRLGFDHTCMALIIYRVTALAGRRLIECPAQKAICPSCQVHPQCVNWKSSFISHKANTRSNNCPPNKSSPGDFTHLRSRFPAFLLSQLPLSPGLSPTSSSSRMRRLRLSTTHIPRVHWPDVSILMSSSSMISQSFIALSVAIQYQMQSGS